MPEVGNVLAHYGVGGHTVVDKYETAGGVHNVAVLDYHDDRGFDLIVSISTLEHTGFEEEVDEPAKPGRVARHPARMLAPGGRAVLTFPGVQPGSGRADRRAARTFGTMRGPRRISADNRSTDCTVEDVRGARYGAPYLNANTLVVAMIPAAE